MTLAFIAVSRSRRPVLIIKKIDTITSVSGENVRSCQARLSLNDARTLISGVKKPAVFGGLNKTFTVYGNRAGSGWGAARVRTACENQRGSASRDIPPAKKKPPAGGRRRAVAGNT